MTVQVQRDPLLTEEQVARMLGIQPASLQIWRSTKRYALAYIKVGRLVRYRLSAVNAFLASREVSQ
jgi:predicted DNA-binding transcriptional regulator AlpA